MTLPASPILWVAIGLVLAAVTCLVCAVPSLPEGKVSRAVSSDRLIKVRDAYMQNVAGYPFFVRFLGLVGGEVGLSEEGGLELSRKLELAGYPLGLTTEEFQALRVLSGLTGLIIGMGTGWIAFGPMAALVVGFMFFAIWVYVPTAMVDGELARTRGRLGRDIPYVIDLVTLTMEAGATFLQALQEAVHSLKGEPVSEELATMLQELDMGVSREQAMRNLASRVHLDWFTSFVNTVIAAEGFGVPMVQALREQGELLRIERAQRAARLAEEAPTKLTFPSVLQMATIIFLIAGIFWMKQVAGDYSRGAF